MKPISLTMQAFGPYLDAATVDFSRLGEHPIFLITGSTGGGKTTILDAMCFALYCRATGGRRSWGSMRSTSAPDDRATLVDFAFSLGGEEYRFCRSQAVHIVRGSGRREIREEHLCYKKEQGEWQLLLSGSETKIRERAQLLLGLTCEQFSQVIVLPQGDFLKLLRANSVNKAEILQTLFATKLWADVAKRCKTMAEEFSQKAGECRAARLSILEREGVETKEALEEKNQQAEHSLKEMQRQASVLQAELEKERILLANAKELEQKFQKKMTLEQRWKQLCSQEKTMEQKREIAVLGRKMQQVFPYVQAWKAAEQEAAAKVRVQMQAEASQKEAEAAYLNAEKVAGEIPVWREQAAVWKQEWMQLQESYQNAVRLDEISRQLREKQETIAQQTKQKEQAEVQYQTTKTRLKNGEKHVAQAQDDMQKLPHWLQETQKWEKYQELFQGRREKEAAWKKAEEAFQEAERSRQKYAVQADAQRSKLEQEEARLRQDQAYSLASVLREGEACPVCGSQHHPFPAKAKGSYNAQQLELLRGSVQEQEQALRTWEQTANLAKVKMEQCASDYQAQQALCQEISLSEEELETQRKTAQTSLTSAQQAASRLEKYRKAMEQIQREQEQAQKAKEEAVEMLGKLEKEAAVLQTSQEEILRQVGAAGSMDQIKAKQTKLKKQEQQWTQKADDAEKRLALAKTAFAVAQTEGSSAKLASKEAAEKNRQAKEAMERSVAQVGLDPAMDFQSFQRNEEELSALEQQITRYEQERHTVEEQYRAYEAELEGKELPDVQGLEEKQTELQEQSQTMAQHLGGLLQQLEMGRQSLEQLDSLAKNSTEAEEKFSQISRLSQLLLGKNPLKIPLQQFVLGIMLDDILSCANRFFSMLSQGRYSLRRIVGNTGGNSFGGLDLEVLDANMGGARSIETLSGGEQFLASLSLAFGLSDVVQSYSGSVRLDSIFIDEGFGSLDQETLDTAMKALAQIQKMGRTIGIISHVSELKGRIAARIEVGRKPSGSAAISIIAATCNGLFTRE